MVGVVAHERGEIECNRQAGLATREQELVPLVGVLGGPEPGKLPHGPQAAAVHVGVNAAGIRKAAWQAGSLQQAGRNVGRRVGNFERLPGDGGEVGVVPHRLARSPRAPLGHLATQRFQFLLLLPIAFGLFGGGPRRHA